jgi:heme exporter protein D
MENLLQRLALLARTEALDLRLRTRRAVRAAVLLATALACALFAFAFVNYCVFVWLAQSQGPTLAALVLAAIDAVLAIALLAAANRRTPTTEEAMVDELRALTLAELGNDAERIKANLEVIQQQIARIGDGISRVTGDPLQIGLSTIGPLLGLAARLMHRKKDAD